MSVSNRAILTFRSDTAQVARLSIPRANLAKTADDAKASMEAIISTGIVTTSQGSPLFVKGAELVSTQRTSIIPAN